ncbi:hypothetical protein [Ekhidna sp.]|uniref:hypothetical protein n=1 Tax=Ekhidna sp. TaxID=2608089 RepID=UPI003CCC22CB
MKNSLRPFSYSICFVLMAFISVSCKDDGDTINVLTSEDSIEMALDSIANTLTGSYPVQLKRTPINPSLNTLGDEIYTYDLTIDYLLGNKIRLTSGYDDIGDDFNEHELGVSVAAVVGNTAFLKVDPVWNYLQPIDRTYEAIGTGSFSYLDQSYDGVFDLTDNRFELKFEGTISTATRLYIITSN